MTATDTKDLNAFKDAILERPDVAAPKLMLADWLEERGEDRAARYLREWEQKGWRPRTFTGWHDHTYVVSRDILQGPEDLPTVLFQRIDEDEMTLGGQGMGYKPCSWETPPIECLLDAILSFCGEG